MKTITEFELLAHGFGHSQYFQGCGISFTKWAHVVTGCGGSEKEAFADALEQIHTSIDTSIDTAKIEEEANAEGLSMSTLEDLTADNEVYYYFSIRYNLEQAK